MLAAVMNTQQCPACPDLLRSGHLQEVGVSRVRPFASAEVWQLSSSVVRSCFWCYHCYCHFVAGNARQSDRHQWLASGWDSFEATLRGWDAELSAYYLRSMWRRRQASRSFSLVLRSGVSKMSLRRQLTVSMLYAAWGSTIRRGTPRYVEGLHAAMFLTVDGPLVLDLLRSPPELIMVIL
jgi:hypothetical protein